MTLTKDRVRWTLLTAVLLVAVGFIGGFLVRRGLGPSAWDEQVELDTKTWMTFLRPDPRQFLTPDEVPEFRAAWAERQAVYDPEAMDALRGRLHAYLDFLESEYADAADIWDSGDDSIQSETARENREKLRARLGPLAEQLIRDADETVRDEAYRSSPHTIKDENPADFRLVYQDVREWVGIARGVVDEYVVVAASH